jgi:hypothetical protein
VDSITARLERKVANCLSCGKIFDCRNVTSDVMRFIGKQHTKAWCGARHDRSGMHDMGVLHKHTLCSVGRTLVCLDATMDWLRAA